MEFEYVCSRMELPHEDQFRWRRLQALYKTLQSVHETRTLVSVLLQIYQASGHDIFSEEHTTVSPSGGHAEWYPFTGLKIFLDNIATTSERSSFFEAILPKIISLASLLDRHAPTSGILLSRRQKIFQASLSKNFVASIWASGFLCAFPPCSSAVKTKTANFITLYGNIQRSEYKDKAVDTLRYYLQYFDKLSLSELDSPAEIVLQRQVVRKSLLPSIADWENSDAELCPLIVVHEKTPHDSETNLSQVDCCSCFNSNVMNVGHLITKPEAAVAMVFMEPLEDNEKLIVKHEADGHVERFVGWTDRQAEDSQRELVLRYLNKALVCFQSQESIRELVKTKSINVRQNGDQLEHEEDEGDKSINPGREDDSDEIQISTKNEPMNVDIEVTDITGNTSIAGIDTYCDSLVGHAYRQARGEIDINSEDRRGMLENLMKKSLHEVFWKTPEKERMFTDSIIYSPQLPKCLLHFHTDGDSISPIVPSTPPSSPAKRGLGSSSSQPSFMMTSPLGSPLIDQLRMGTKSFADSLAEALMSCVLLSSSLATSIATEALDSVSITSVTMEMLQDSPKKVFEAADQNYRLSQSSSFSRNHHLDNTSFHRLTNGDIDSGLIDNSSQSSSFDSDEEQEVRRRSLNELALNLFENFATQLSHSIIQNSTRFIDDTPLDSIDEVCSGVREDKCCNGSRTDLIEDVDLPGIRINKSHEEEASSDKYTDTDSDVSEGQWYGLDIDKELEDKFYELDLTDNEDNEDNEDNAAQDDFHTNLTRMADDMLTNVFDAAFSEATIELENMDTTVEYFQEEEEITIESDSADSSGQNHFLENSGQLRSDVFQQYAFNVSTGVIQNAVEDFASDRESLSFSTTPLSQSTTDFGSTTGKEESDEDRRESYDSNNSNPFSHAQTELLQYAQVLSEQLIETSVAIAGTATSSRVGFVHPIATSRWCSEDVGIDVQMEAMLQWSAASFVGCPAVTFLTMCDERLEKFSKVQQILRERHYRVCDILDIILRYSQTDVHTSDTSHNLFQFIMERIS